MISAAVKMVAIVAMLISPGERADPNAKPRYS
jgi:hypothetical protein